MVLGKVRNNRRSSVTSYASTVTTVVFIALCVLGVWMLTSNSVVPPETTARTDTATTDAATDSSSTMEPDNTKPTNKIDNPVFEDNQGQLPVEVIKSDEPKEANRDKNDSDESKEANRDKNDSDESKEANRDKNDPTVYEDNPGQLPVEAITSDEPKEAYRDKKSREDQKDSRNIEISSNTVGNKSREDQKDSRNIEISSNTVGNNTKTDKQGNRNEKKNVEGNVMKEAGSAVPENPYGFQGKESAKELEKQKAQETQISEESSMTVQSQQVVGTMTKNQNISSNKNSEGKEAPKSEAVEQTPTDHAKVDKPLNSQDTQHRISDKDQHPPKKQEKEQSQKEVKEAISDDQVQHDEASVDTTKAQVENQETQHNNTEKEKESNLPSLTKQVEDKPLTKQVEDKPVKLNSNESVLEGASSGIPKESNESKKSWSTQADQSHNQKERGKSEGQDGSIYGYTWQLCNVSAGPDYIPCLDNEKALRYLHTTRHYEHRERHCPEEGPTCLVPVPEGYKRPIGWPESRDKIWYRNVPHTKLVEVKGHQNWVKVMGEFLTFPGGGTQFIHGALHYIDFIQTSVPDIAWGKHTRVVLDVGCGVASFGGYLFNRDVLAMSFAPKDEHEAQVQFALERGIPAISAVMGSQRLPFPSRVFDLVHCARCRVPWHVEGGSLLLELNRVLRPGGYFVWSATPVYKRVGEDMEIWIDMTRLTRAICWELVTISKDKLNKIAAAIYRKPVSNECYDQRRYQRPPMCRNRDDPNAAWYVPLQSCMHHIPVSEIERGSRWPEDWPKRLQTPPYWLKKSQMGIYGKPAPEDFAADYEHWKRVVSKSYISGLGISWANVRNVMDMRAVYGGFAAAMRDHNVWVLNVVNIDSPDTLPIIYERGLFGIYHDWCESFSTYPRSYDLLHADQLFSKLKKRCKIVPLMAEIDRIVRPGGKLIVRDESSTIGEVENLLKSMHWEVHLTFSKNQQGILSAQKSDWRPDSYAASS